MKENYFLFFELYGEQINIPPGIYPFEPQKLKLLRKGTIKTYFNTIHDSFIITSMEIQTKEIYYSQ